MNVSIRTIGLLALGLCACKAQAYTFTVKNFTNKAHSIKIQLKGIAEKPSKPQVVAAYDENPLATGWAQVQQATAQFKQKAVQVAEQAKGKIEGWMSDLMKAEKTWNQKLETMQINLMQKAKNIDLNELSNELEKLEADISKKIKDDIASIDEHLLMDKINNLRKDINSKVTKLNKKIDKEVTSLDIKDWGKKLSMVQKDVSDKLTTLNQKAKDTLENANSNTIKFEIGGLRSGLCLSKIFVDEKPCTIYGLKTDYYNSLQENYVSKGDITTYVDRIKAERSTFTEISKSPVGICLSRQFDLIEDNGELILVTPSSLMNFISW